jgi:hypothetical protein
VRDVRGKLATERKVSFERDELDASKACHISTEEMLKAVLQGVEAPAQEREEKRWRVFSTAGLNAFRSIERSREPSWALSSRASCAT